MKLKIERWASPLSDLLIVTDDDGALRALEFADLESRMHRLLAIQYERHTIEEGSSPMALKAALTAYFAGTLNALDLIPTASGGTEFQREVWQALRSIPAASTVSYARLAATIGRPAAVRAVGAANGANPICIVIPCHRVIGSDGSLTGYGGGLPRKKWLLAHEGCLATGSAPPR